MEPPAAEVYTMRPVIPQDRTDSTARITISNIPPGVTEAQLVANLKHHGDAKVHMFVPGCEYSPGWAWISFPTEKEVQRVLEVAHTNARSRAEAESAKVPAPTSAESMFEQQPADNNDDDNKHQAEEAEGKKREGEPAGSTSTEPSYSDSAPMSSSDEGEDM